MSNVNNNRIVLFKTSNEMIPYTLFVTVIILVIFLGYIDLKKKQNFMKKLGNVNIDYLPILGNILNFLPKGYTYFFDWLSSQEPSGFLWVLSVPLFYTRRPEEVQIILLNKNSLAKSMGYRFGSPFKYSLVATSVESWRPHRRLLNKCFRQKQIFEFIPKYGDFSKIAMDKLLPKMTAEDLSEIFMLNILDAYFGTLGGFGINDFHSMMTVNVHKMLQFFEAILIKRLVSPWLYLNSIFFRTDDGRQYKKLTEKISSEDKKIYDFMKAKHIQNGEEDTTKIHDFVNVLMNHYSAEETDSEMNLFVIAAEHTTGSTVAAILLLLGMHQNVQEKLYQEIVKVVGEDDPIRSEHLPKLKYTLMVIHEALRLFPPIQCVARRATNDIYLGGNRFIPKGTEIVISIKDVHRDEKLWENPLKFIPERFSRKEVEKRHPCCFIPFSYGSRNCIAYKFAETVMKIYVADIVRKYRISSNCKEVSDIVTPKGLMFVLPDGIEVEFEKR